MKTVVIWLVVVVVIAAIIIACPLIILWSLNTLFDLRLEYTVANWAAALFLGGLFMSPSPSRSKS